MVYVFVYVDYVDFYIIIRSQVDIMVWYPLVSFLEGGFSSWNSVWIWSLATIFCDLSWFLHVDNW